jgi:hypothetical protein
MPGMRSAWLRPRPIPARCVLEPRDRGEPGMYACCWRALLGRRQLLISSSKPADCWGAGPMPLLLLPDNPYPPYPSSSLFLLPSPSPLPPDHLCHHDGASAGGGLHHQAGAPGRHH